MSMNVNLTPLLEKMVREKVSSGLCTSQVKSSGKRCGSWMSEIRFEKQSLICCGKRFAPVLKVVRQRSGIQTR